MPEPLNLLTFDLDDCLVATGPAQTKVFKEVYPQIFHLSEEERADRGRQVYKNHGCAISYYADRMGKPAHWIEDIYTHIAQQVLAELEEHVPVCLVRPDLLTQLTAKGYTLAIITQGQRYYANEVLRHMGLLQHFNPDYILGRDSVGFTTKRTVHPYQELLRRLPKKPDSKFMLEDSALNLAAAHQLGFNTALIHKTGPNDDQKPFVEYHAQTLIPFLRAKLDNTLNTFRL